MSQKDRVLEILARGPATAPQIADEGAIHPASLQALLSKLRAKGIIECRGVCSRDPWRLVQVPTGDDPSMIPGGPLPPCEVAAAQAAEIFVPPDDAPEEEWPSADIVALAVIVAARVCAEDPLQIAKGGWLRCRFPAAKALRVFYPRCSYAQIGRYLGLMKLTEGTIRTFESAAWWPDLGDAAFEAAVSALEAL